MSQVVKGVVPAIHTSSVQAVASFGLQSFALAQGSGALWSCFLVSHHIPVHTTYACLHLYFLANVCMFKKFQYSAFETSFLVGRTAPPARLGLNACGLHHVLSVHSVTQANTTGINSAPCL